MTDLPPICVMFTTYNRTEYALRVIKATKEKLTYDGELKWYIADAGSEMQHLEAIDELLNEDEVFHKHSAELTPGQNWNKAIKNIYNHFGIYLRLEDDFELLYPLDISKWVRLLEYNVKVGMVRMGLMTVGTQLSVRGQIVPSEVGHDRDIYLHVLKTAQYCFSGHPSLLHARFHEAYGYFPENRDPGQTEVDFDGIVRTTEGPEIWIPFDLGRYGTWGCFAHIGNQRSY